MILAALLSSLLCRFRGHKFRRAHRDEDQAKRFCKVCGAASDVKPRKAKVVA